MKYRFRRPLPVGLTVRHASHEWPGAHRGTATILARNPDSEARGEFSYVVRMLPGIQHGNRIQRWRSSSVIVPDGVVERCGHADADLFPVIGSKDRLPVCPACGVLMCQWTQETAAQTLKTPAEYTGPCERPGVEQYGDELLCAEHLAAAREEDAIADAAYAAEMAEVLDELRYGDPLHRGLPDDPDLPLY